MEILISGAGIAGPAAAYWLHRAGFSTTIVEAAPGLRRGGQAVDFRGPVHRAMLDKMALWEAIGARQTHQGAHLMIDGNGRTVASLPPFLFSGDVEILRGDLSELLYERTRAHTEYLFGDSIAALEERGDRVRVRFESGRQRDFALVIGADGLHSRVRALAFGDEASWLRHHGYAIAGFSLDNILGIESAVTYSRPRRSVSVAAARDGRGARALFCFRSPPLARGLDRAAAQALVENAFAGAGWEVPRLLEAMRAADDLFFDSIASVHLPRVVTRRVALVGDAAFGGTLGGLGTPLAIIGAYVLAGELGRAAPDEALRAYEARMRPYAVRGQSGCKHVGGFHAPANRLALGFRNFYLRLLTTRLFERLFARMVTSRAVDFELPDYHWPR